MDNNSLTTDNSIVFSSVWQDRGCTNGKIKELGFDLNACIVYGMSYALNQTYALTLEKQSFEENYITGNRNAVEKRAAKNERKHYRKGGKHIFNGHVPLPDYFDLRNRYAKESVSSFNSLCEKYGLEENHLIHEDMVSAWTDPYDDRNCLMAKRITHTYDAKADITPDMFKKYFYSVWEVFDRIKDYEELHHIVDFHINVLKTIEEPERKGPGSGFEFCCTDAACGFKQYSSRMQWTDFREFGLDYVSSPSIQRAICIFVLSQIAAKLADEKTGNPIWKIPNSISCYGWDEMGIGDIVKGCEFPLIYCGEMKTYKAW